MSYELDKTTKFEKDLQKALKHGVDPEILEDVVDKLASGESLPQKHWDHPLKGRNCRECHILPDLLLLYRINRKLGRVILIRLGSHSELFK